MCEKEMMYAEELIKVAGRFKHPVLQALIKGIARDSEKHSLFYDALATFLSSTQPVLVEEEFRIISEGIEKHIRIEEEMIESTRRILESVDDPRLKLLLSAIYDDEVKHHELLLAIKRAIAERERFGEEELWDTVWRDSPWHGTPGG